MIEVQWANEKKNLLKLVFHKEWSQHDFAEACTKSVALLDEQHKTVDIVVDMTQSKIYPKQIAQLAVSAMSLQIPNIDKIVVISYTRLWFHIYQYLKRAYRIGILPVQFADTHYEAMILLDMPFEQGGWDASLNRVPTYTGKSVAPFYWN